MGARATSSEALMRAANRPTVSYSLGQIHDYGANMTEEKLLRSSRYVHRELQTRIAKQVQWLYTLPYVLVTNSHISSVLKLYETTLAELRAFPEVKTVEQDLRFTEMLRHMFQDTGVVIDLMSAGLAETISHVSRKALNVDAFMDNMIRSRIGRRTLAEQHIALHDPPVKDWVGIICDRTTPADCVRRAAALAGELCTEVFTFAPEVDIFGQVNTSFKFIPFHLEYICVELLKNSMRAVCEHAKKQKREHALPPIRVLIAQGESEITLRISDEGGGIPRDMLAEVFKYGFSTAPDSLAAAAVVADTRPFDMNQIAAKQTSKRMLAGKGFGLPMSRNYAEYFGGSLALNTIEGYGTDVYIHLDKTAATPEVLSELLHA